MTTIVVGYTPTPPARAALRRAVEESRLRTAELLVINASPGDRYSDPGFAEASELDQVRQLLDTSGVTYEIRQPVRGRDGAEEVLHAAEESGAQLIVIGLRRRTAVGKLLLGSTAQSILLGASCDVLAVKA